jgi:hypothetical protein
MDIGSQVYAWDSGGGGGQVNGKTLLDAPNQPGHMSSAEVKHVAGSVDFFSCPCPLKGMA